MYESIAEKGAVRGLAVAGEGRDHEPWRRPESDQDLVAEVHRRAGDGRKRATDSPVG